MSQSFEVQKFGYQALQEEITRPGLNATKLSENDVTADIPIHTFHSHDKCYSEAAFLSDEISIRKQQS